MKKHLANLSLVSERSSGTVKDCRVGQSSTAVSDSAPYGPHALQLLDDHIWVRKSWEESLSRLGTYLHELQLNDSTGRVQWRKS